MTPRSDAGVYSDEHLAHGWGSFVCLEFVAHPTVEHMCFDESSLSLPNHAHFASLQVLLSGLFAVMSTFTGFRFNSMFEPYKLPKNLVT